MSARFDKGRLARLDAHLAGRVAAGDYERLEWAVGDSSGIVHEARTGVAASLFRIYSMTKPIVSVVALQLLEEGKLQLYHPISRWLPEFEAPLVFTAKGPQRASTKITVWHLLTHTAGLSYGFLADATGAMLNGAKVHADGAAPLRDDVRKIAAIPLQFEPGARWRYSVATDVLGALIEEVEGKPLGEIVAARVTGPLGMGSTTYHPGAEAGAKLPPVKGGGPGGLISAKDLAKSYPFDEPGFARGGHGLFSTLADYAKFARALLLDARGAGAPRLLAPAVIQHATRNHVAPLAPLAIEAPPGAIGPGLEGQGFGLGFAVSLPAGTMVSRPGAFGWSGAAETWFTVDPASEMFAVLMAQNFDWPGASYDLQTMAYAALVG